MSSDEGEEEELGEGMTIASKIKMNDLAVTQVGGLNGQASHQQQIGCQS
jgi:hypothetical protein